MVVCLFVWPCALDLSNPIQPCVHRERTGAGVLDHQLSDLHTTSSARATTTLDALHPKELFCTFPPAEMPRRAEQLQHNCSRPGGREWEDKNAVGDVVQLFSSAV